MTAIIISVGASLLSGGVLFFLKRYFDKRDRKDEQSEARRHEKDKLLFKSIKSIGDLAAASATALVSGKPNGECHKALADYDKVDKEVYEFLISNE